MRLQCAVEWLDIAGRCYVRRDIYMKKKTLQLSRHCFSISRPFRKNTATEVIGKTYRADRKRRSRSATARCLREPRRERWCAPRLYAPFNPYFKTRRWKNVCYVATVRSDLFYWDVGTSVQFTKCPVEHGGPVIVSMIRTSFRAPIRRIRELFRYF